MESIENKIIRKIKKSPKGTIYFTEDFLDFGTAKGVSKALERLVSEDTIVRVARGIYARVEVHPSLGKLMPGIEAIADAIRRRDRARVTPTGAAALNALGLSTQMPMNVVYLTDGAARKIIIGKQKIIFKKTTPKNLSAKGKISGLVIQAMKDIGKDKLSDEEIDVILQHLANEHPKNLEHDIKLAPEWIRIIMRRSMKKNYGHD